ncbi:MAG TPA: Cof-type HAD-IIB family hydrolase [Acidisphaera sp.]|nr:Cof-type HAD-IIB family hydrolase [Acidisphaera sp.]
MTLPDREIALVLSDVDGTLVKNDKSLAPSTIETAHALRDAGIRLAITSGRPPRGMEMLIEPLMLEGMIAGFNGGVFVDPDMTVRESRLLDPAIARQAAESIAKAGLDVWVYTCRDWLIRDPKAPHVEHEAFTVKFAPVVVPSFTGEHFEDCAKIVGVSDDFPLVERVEQETQQALDGDASATRSQPYYLDVTSPKANKGAVVDTLAAIYNLHHSQIVTIGDGPNDRLMFRRSGFSIAMGNGSEEVRNTAKVVTDSNEDDGWAKAVRKYILRA